MLASSCFFFALGYGSRRLAPLFSRPYAWRIFDVLTAGIMFAVVARLIAHPS
jgi:L-lysine exporter family protein LysE/ArgO